MRGDDAAIYREIQKNAEMGIKAIETLTPKLSDDAFALQLSRQELNIRSSGIRRGRRCWKEEGKPIRQTGYRI